MTIEGVLLCVRRISKRRKVVVAVNLDAATGDEVDISFDKLAEAQVPRRSGGTQDLDELDPDKWEQALTTFRNLRPLLYTDVLGVEEVDKVANAAGMSRSTVYRLVNKFKADPRVSVFLRADRADRGTTKLLMAVEKIMSEIIIGKLLNQQKLKPTKCFREVEERCKEQGFAVPHINTFFARIRKIAPVAYATARRGQNAALPFKPIGESIEGAESPYSLIQIDHTPVDVILVDSVHRVPLKRPYLTLAIDCYSRMVAGYYISFDPPGTLGTGICIANSILTKGPLLARFGLDMEWLCEGIPGSIHLDNAREFHGNSLKNACAEYGINLLFRNLKKPQHGAYIERLMGTFMSEVHALPGTTFSRSSDKDEYRPEKEAAMTLEEFERWLLNLINAYHNRKHEGLGTSPLQMYLDAVVGDDDMPASGLTPYRHDPEQLRINFLPFERRSVQAYGILLDNIYYYSDILQRWIGSRDPSETRRTRKFLIRRDPRDISFILFWDPELHRYFRIPYRNTSYPALSLWELRTINRYLEERGAKNIDEEQIFAAYREMRSIAETAKVTTKQAKAKLLSQERQGSMQRHPSSGDATSTSAAPVLQVDLPVAGNSMNEAIVPFDEVE